MHTQTGLGINTHSTQSALRAKLPLSLAEHTLFFISSLTMPLGRLLRSPPVGGVILHTGNVWTSHPKRLQCVFTRWR